MGDASSQHAQALELLDFPHLGFESGTLLSGPFALGDIDVYAHDPGDLALSIMERCR